MSEELDLNEAPRWTVEPVIGRDPKLKGKRKKAEDAQVILRHELRYKGKRHEKGITQREVERLREMARIFNQKGATPNQITRRGDIQMDLFDPSPAASTEA